MLSFVSSISLKNRMPVIPFASERVFNSATFMPMLIPLKTLRNVSNLHLKIYSGLKMGQAQINVRTRACSRTSIARTKQAALTHNVRGKELNQTFNTNSSHNYRQRFFTIKRLPCPVGITGNRFEFGVSHWTVRFTPLPPF